MATLLIALAVVLFVALVVVALAGSGWLPRLAARGAHTAAGALEARGKRSRLDSRDRAELRARLWVPW
ncbi:MAG: hypothetical protein HYY03_01380 [Chloroflexi bacterium]|nr:hypothetical protein [Chloroflexota bacterium]